MLTLLHLPTEILSNIFQLACAIGPNSPIRRPLGFTLGLVCRTFRHISQADGLDIEYAYVRGAQRMFSFVELLRKRNPYAKRVRSLMLGDDEIGGVDDILHPFSTTHFMADILAMINPSRLRVLALFSSGLYSHYPRNLTLPVTFPALTDVFLSGILLCNSPYRTCYAPHLERMQLLRMLIPPDDLPAQLCSLAPNLQRLKLGLQANTTTAINLAIPFVEFRVSRIQSKDHASEDNGAEVRQEHPFPHALRQIVVDLFPHYFPSASKDYEQEIIESLIQRMNDGARVFERLIRPSLEGYEEEGDINFDLEEWCPPAVYSPIPIHHPMCVLVIDEQQRFREFVKNWEKCTQGANVTWK
ncbi:hypothetical protein EIP91_004073 [Steccherinum ochraceum]|uniref:F-box domain-containing protein n=1 Tax=Steccherinum ochraceum TaxID=92696 RepID=A0A4R0RHZ5_9APHY|nr:hypothetical protein EIP91_004073 [Steccherinum ochraceum]